MQGHGVGRVGRTRSSSSSSRDTARLRAAETMLPGDLWGKGGRRDVRVGPGASGNPEEVQESQNLFLANRFPSLGLSLPLCNGPHPGFTSVYSPAPNDSPQSELIEGTGWILLVLSFTVLHCIWVLDPTVTPNKCILMDLAQRIRTYSFIACHVPGLFLSFLDVLLTPGNRLVVVPHSPHFFR